MPLEKQGDLVQEWKTDLHACSIENVFFHPETNKCMFLCGLYELVEEDAQRRSGKVVLYDYDLSNQEVSRVDSADCQSGVLDMKLDTSKSFVAASLSSGQVEIYNLKDDPIDTKLVHKHSLSDAEDTSLYLSVCWNENPKNICVSTQNGSIIVFDCNSESMGRVSDKIENAHCKFGESMPAWISIFDPNMSSGGKRLLSGGDDCCMKFWDLRSSHETPVHTNNKTHQSGVTSAQWHTSNPNIFATGSYDEYLRIWDDRNLSRPVHEIHTHGGVWRVKWHEQHATKDLSVLSYYIATASMQGGCCMYRLNSDFQTCDSSVSHADLRNENHLAYGIDILHTQPNEIDNRNTDFVLASCSFYDNLAQIWKCSL